jgi:hypothetical protein
MLKASALKNNESQKKAISKEVTAILSHIDDELKVAHEQGKSRVLTGVPITFSVPYMTNKDAQRKIYYHILISLIDRGFNAKIEMRADSTIFHITWLTREEQEELAVQHALLAKHTIKSQTGDLSDLK